MAFGQSSGPPASAREIAQLTELLEQAGFGSFKEARHPFGLTQRQAAGKFTRDEVTELVARLEEGADGASTGPEAQPLVAPDEVTLVAGAPSNPRRGRGGRDQKLVVAGLSDDVLAKELELRGWTCIPPL